MFHGISLHLTPWSQAIVNGIVKYAYPPTGQIDTTVVLFREENLAELAESFPVSYARHAEVLEALASYGPRAVFVDFAFIDARSPEDQALLARAICDLNARGKVPVYLAAPAPSGGRDEGARVNPALLECAEAVNAQMDVERGVSGVLTYAHGGGTGGFRWTPAFAMYDAYARVESKPRLSPEDAQPMEIIWGNLASEPERELDALHERGGAVATSSTSSGRTRSRPSGRARTRTRSRCSTSSGPTTRACRRPSRARRSSTGATSRWWATG